MATEFTNMWIVRAAVDGAPDSVLDDLEQALGRLLDDPRCCEDPSCYPMRGSKAAGRYIAELPHGMVITYTVGPAFPRTDETINIRSCSPSPLG